MKKPFLIIVLLLASTLLTFSISAANPVKAQTPNVNITLYAGEIYSSDGTLLHGAFGLTADNITSPGPTLTFTSGETVNLTLVVVGKLAHSFAITDAKATDATGVFNAAIANGTNPIPTGTSASVVFVVGSAGNYFYLCRVPGHVALGMWGNVVVNAAVPEFAPTMWLATGGLLLTVATAYIAILKRQNKI